MKIEQALAGLGLSSDEAARMRDFIDLCLKFDASDKSEVPQSERDTTMMFAGARMVLAHLAGGKLVERNSVIGKEIVHLHQIISHMEVVLTPYGHERMKRASADRAQRERRN
jgi:hypothetical protein